MCEVSFSPFPFDPRITVAESEGLTRRMHEQWDRGTSEGVRESPEIERPLDVMIDPSHQVRETDCESGVSRRPSREHIPFNDGGRYAHDTSRSSTAPQSLQKVPNAAYIHPPGHGSTSASRAPVLAPSRLVLSPQRNCSYVTVVALRAACRKKVNICSEHSNEIKSTLGVNTHRVNSELGHQWKALRSFLSQLNACRYPSCLVEARTETHVSTIPSQFVRFIAV
jgi:hypothetical protein